MKVREHALLFLRKAEQDEFVLALPLGSPDSPEEAVGFHAQQAVEKRIKAVLASAGIVFRRTHDIAELLDLAADHGIAVPAAMEELRWLTPFAVEFRYDDLPAVGEEPLDREWVERSVRVAKEWSARVIGHGSEC